MYERAVLLHLSLFLIFGKGDFDAMTHGTWTEMQFDNTIQTLCPHLLRYRVIGVLLNTSAPNDLNKVADLVSENAFAYKDSVTEFLRLLVLENDFDGAREALEESQEVIANDFFASFYLDVFNEAARQVILRKYCKLYYRIEVAELKRYLLFAEDEECLSFIARCHPSGGDVSAADRDLENARIDMANRAVYIQHAQESPYQELLYKYHNTYDIHRRTQGLIDDIARRNKK